MKAVFLIAICAFSCGLCQEPRQDASPWKFTLKSDKGTEAFSLRAVSATQNGEIIHLRSAEIATGAVLVRADSADFNVATGQLQPHGKVTITFQNVGRGVPPGLMRELLQPAIH
jgi:hypothetical protein